MNTLDLNGTWQLGWADGVRGAPWLADRDPVDEARFLLQAQVPGEVHLDLERAGIIDDVRLGLNALKARWVEETRWIYRREFEAPAEAVEASGAWLVFEGLDLTARVVLNGETVAHHNNAFHPCRVNVAGKLRPGSNTLVVHIESGLYHVAEKPLGHAQYTADHRLNKRQWLRKAPCQFGWDWSIRLINVGIYRPVRLEWAAVATIDQLAVSAQLAPDLKHGTVQARLFVEALREASGRLTIRVGDSAHAVAVTVVPGLHPYEVSVEVPNPELWWPAEHGAQHLYPVRVALEVEGKLIGERSARVGFRRIAFVQDEHPETGRYFILEVNGRKLFVKGANWAPGDMILASCDRESYRRSLGLAREAHFNFLRINGCGIYENDEFYDVCDETGIMVWQDFIFTNIHYPLGEAEFRALLEPELRYNIRRIQAHPSLVVWCGNNEMEWLGGGAATIGTENDDITFFHEELPRIVKEEDPTNYYQPSSPFSPDGIEANADHAGNQHPWSIGMGDTDFHKYRRMICRFATEGGFMGPSALPTLRSCFAPGDDKPWSFSWQQHDNSIAQNEHPSPQDRMFEEWLGKDLRALSIEEYCYWGGVLQGEALREYAENFRRRMFDSAATAFWDFNDFWPVTRGWAIVDPYFRRAPSFHFVRRAYAEIIVVTAVVGDEAAVFGVNDGNDAVAARLRYGIFDLNGAYPHDETMDVVLHPNTSTRLTSFPMARWTRPESGAAFAVLSSKGELLARNRLFLTRFKDLQWSPAHVEVRLEDGLAKFLSPTFAWSVCLDLDGEKPLADNMFDLYPGQEYAIAWRNAEPPKVVAVGNLDG